VVIHDGAKRDRIEISGIPNSAEGSELGHAADEALLQWLVPSQRIAQSADGDAALGNANAVLERLADASGSGLAGQLPRDVEPAARCGEELCSLDGITARRTERD